MSNLTLSEMFYALQGEGPSAGTPMVMIRLAYCNLNCKWCDSVKIWKQGVETSPALMAAHAIELAGGAGRLISGNVHIVFTGGEPLLERNREGIAEFFIELVKLTGSPMYYAEIETNGTLWDPILEKFFDQINCSPKLASSGHDRTVRIVPEVLARLAKMNTTFKFVVSSEEEWDEIARDFHMVPRDKIMLMPAAIDRDELIKNSPMVWNLAAMHGVKATSRLHVIAWDKKTGV